jgi:hypothetical protein
MANRYWVGGSGNWTDTAHWSTTSGGAGGASAPTNTDDAFIDNMSGIVGGVIVCDHSSTLNRCLNLTSTAGGSYTISGGNYDSYSLFVHGSATLEEGLLVTNTIYFYCTAPATLDPGGAFINSVYIASSSSVTLSGNLDCNGLYITEGTFDANHYDVIASLISIGAYNKTVVIYMGNGTWTIDPNPTVNTNYGATGNVTAITWATRSTSITLHSEGSTLVLDNSRGPWGLNGSGTTLCLGNKDAYYSTVGMTFNDVVLTGDSGCNFRIGCNNTFNNFVVDADAPYSVYFQAGTTQTVSNFYADGSSGNFITFDRWVPDWVQSSTITLTNGDVYRESNKFYVITDASSWNWSQNFATNVFYGRATLVSNPQHNLSKSSGKVRCRYLDLSNSNATGGAEWYAIRSYDTANNDGWIFPSPYPPYILDGTATYSGVYSLGRYSMSYPMVLDLTYPISPNVFTGVEIGDILVVGDEFFVSWKTYDGADEVYGIDKLDYSALYTDASLETRMLTGSRSRYATFKDFILSYSDLPAGTNYKYYYSIDYGNTWTEIDLTKDTMRKILEGHGMAESTTLQLRIDAQVSGNNGPVLEKGLVTVT